MLSHIVTGIVHAHLAPDGSSYSDVGARQNGLSPAVPGRWLGQPAGPQAQRLPIDVWESPDGRGGHHPDCRRSNGATLPQAWAPEVEIQESTSGAVMVTGCRSRSTRHLPIHLWLDRLPHQFDRSWHRADQ